MEGKQPKHRKMSIALRIIGQKREEGWENIMEKIGRGKNKKIKEKKQFMENMTKR